jgi:hypothetical protein
MELSTARLTKFTIHKVPEAKEWFGRCLGVGEDTDATGQQMAAPLLMLFDGNGKYFTLV